MHTWETVSVWKHQIVCLKCQNTVEHPCHVVSIVGYSYMECLRYVQIDSANSSKTCNSFVLRLRLADIEWKGLNSIDSLYLSGQSEYFQWIWAQERYLFHRSLIQRSKSLILEASLWLEPHSSDKPSRNLVETCQEQKPYYYLRVGNDTAWPDEQVRFWKLGSLLHTQSDCTYCSRSLATTCWCQLSLAVGVDSTRQKTLSWQMAPNKPWNKRRQSAKCSLFLLLLESFWNVFYFSQKNNSHFLVLFVFSVA